MPGMRGQCASPGVTATKHMMSAGAGGFWHDAMVGGGGGGGGGGDNPLGEGGGGGLGALVPVLPGGVVD